METKLNHFTAAEITDGFQYNEYEGNGLSNGLWNSKSGVKQPLIDGKRKYKRIFVKNKKVQK